MTIPVILESPFAGRGNTELEKALDEKDNVAFVRACMRDSLKRGEAPFASHALYTLDGVLDDNKCGERKLGIEAGLAIGNLCEYTVVYLDRGITKGMQEGIKRASKASRAIIYRRLNPLPVKK